MPIDVESLTPRETEILRLLARGARVKILQCFFSQKTIRIEA